MSDTRAPHPSDGESHAISRVVCRHCRAPTCPVATPRPSVGSLACLQRAGVCDRPRWVRRPSGTAPPHPWCTRAPVAQTSRLCSGTTPCRPPASRPRWTSRLERAWPSPGWEKSPASTSVCRAISTLTSVSGTRSGFTCGLRARARRDFRGCVDVRGEAGPSRAPLAVAWACAWSARRGPGGAAQRLRMARAFAPLGGLRDPRRQCRPGTRRLLPSPQASLLTPDQSSALLPDAQQLGPRGALRLIPCPPGWGCWPARACGR